MVLSSTLSRLNSDNLPKSTTAHQRLTMRAVCPPTKSIKLWQSDVCYMYLESASSSGATRTGSISPSPFTSAFAKFRQIVECEKVPAPSRGIRLVSIYSTLNGSSICRMLMITLKLCPPKCSWRLFVLRLLASCNVRNSFFGSREMSYTRNDILGDIMLCVKYAVLC